MCSTKVRSVSFYWDFTHFHIFTAFSEMEKAQGIYKWLKRWICLLHYHILKEKLNLCKSWGDRKLWKASLWPYSLVWWHPIWDLSNWAELSLGSLRLKETNAQKREYLDAKKLETISKSKSGAIGRGNNRTHFPPKAKIWEQRCYGVPALAEWVLGGQVWT